MVVTSPDNMLFYEFKVFFYDEEDRKNKTEYGITYSPSFSQAVDTIGQWYGDENILSLSIEATDSSYIYTTSEMHKFQEKNDVSY